MLLNTVEFGLIKGRFRLDISTYDHAIQAAMNERARLRGELDSTRAAYIQACVRFFESQFAKTVEEAIKASPEAIKGLGIEKLRQLKAEMNDAIGNLPQTVPKHLNKPELWEHELPEDKLVSETAFNLNWKTGHQKTEGEYGSIMGCRKNIVEIWACENW